MKLKTDSDSVNNEPMMGFTETTYAFVSESIIGFNPHMLSIDISYNSKFEVLVGYSFDNHVFSEFKPITDYEDEPIETVFVCIQFKRIVPNDLANAKTMYDSEPNESKYHSAAAHTKNVDDTEAYIEINSISYNKEIINLSNLRFKETYSIINEFPRWNIYDNQMLSINRWLSSLNAISETYGHTVIYFKTEPIEFTTDRQDHAQSGITGTNYTLANHVIRNVTSIKRLHIMVPSNDLPQDRNVFTDWDMPLQDDFVIHIVRQKFEQAFGLKAIPTEKDYIYFPLINKLFRVSTMQPKNSFMGVIGWYEVYMARYESDDTITIDNDLRNALSGFDEFNDGGVLSEFSEIETDMLLEADGIDKQTLKEKREATDSMSNRLKDSTSMVTLKETEKIRESYNNRLQIVSVNVDGGVFPITMYDCSSVERRVVAMRYSLDEYRTRNGFVNYCNSDYQLIFNVCFTGRHSNEIIDILSGDNTLISISSKTVRKNNRLFIFDSGSQKEFEVAHDIPENELYQVVIEYNRAGHFNVVLSRLQNKQKIQAYSNVYKSESYPKFLITNIHLYGGRLLIGDISFSIDSNKYFEDKCLPLLVK